MSVTHFVKIMSTVHKSYITLINVQKSCNWLEFFTQFYNLKH